MRSNLNRARPVIAALAIAMASGTAYAADVVYQEPPAPSPVIQDLPGVGSWAGPYAGIQGSYGFGGRAATAAGRATTDGFTGGGFAGVQGQTGNFVYGVEADVNYSGVDGTVGGTTVRNRYDGSLRGRAGVAVGDQLMVYGTAGAAMARTRVTDAAGRDTGNMTGWTAGAGIEANVTQEVFARGEYRYTDYGSRTFDTGSGAQRVSNRDHRVGVGVGVRF